MNRTKFTIDPGFKSRRVYFFVTGGGGSPVYLCGRWGIREVERSDREPEKINTRAFILRIRIRFFLPGEGRRGSDFWAGV